MKSLTNCSGKDTPLSPTTEAYPANHHKAGRGRRKQTFGYKRQVLKKRRPARRDRDAAPGMSPRFMVSKGMVNTNNKKVQRTIFGLVLARTRRYITFLGRVEGCIVSTRSLVSVCCITEEVLRPCVYARSSLSSSQERSHNVTLFVSQP